MRIVAGRLCSPGLGNCLGVAITPAERRCSFDCVYCVAPPPEHLEGGARWPSPGDVHSALVNALPGAGDVDSVLVAGAGEPTLHPDFCGVVSSVVGAVRRVRPGLAVRVRTNGSRLLHGDVLRGLDLADERILKLDPAPERVARPGSSTPLGGIVAGAARLRDVSVQAVLVDGPDANWEGPALEAWLELLRELRPLRVYVSTPAAGVHDAAPVDAAVLEGLVARLDAGGLPARVA